MATYVLRRILHMIPLILGISFISFAVLQLAPGDFTTSMQQDPTVSKAVIAQIQHEYGLDKPWPEQYLLWLRNAAHLNFGYSFAYKTAVSQLIWQRMGNTLILAICALLISWGLAIPLGVYIAVHKNTAADLLISLGSFAGISTPGFFLALLVLLFAEKTGWFPVGGMRSPDAYFFTSWHRFTDVCYHLILPALVLGIGSCAGVLRQMRGSLLDTLGDNYVMAARARGLSERNVIWKHAFRNAANPMITLFGLSLAGLLSGSALVESVMAWPGLGKLILDAVIAKDLYLVMGSFVMGAFMLLMGNLAADILLMLADPRIRMN